MIFYGSKGSLLGQYDVEGGFCTNCGAKGSYRMSVFGKYAHIYWIPFFPLGKKTFAECKNCKHTFEESEFPQPLAAKTQEIKDQVKRPLWNWLGLGAVSTIIALLFLVDTFKEVDPREELLRADLALATAAPSEQSDSTAFKLQAFINDFVSDEMDKDQFEYLTKVDGDKVMVLMEIPDLKQVVKEERTAIFEMVEGIVGIEEGLIGKELYIGVHGKYNMMMVKTPSHQESSNIVSMKPLFEFYGPKQVDSN